MNIVRDLPNPIREIDNVWIPLSDGTRLAARIWLPADAEANPVPALLEYIPYRKNDLTAIRDALRHPYFAGHGYASIHVDMRGSGDSDGLLLDEYLPQEQEDAVEVIAWIATQPWCSGNVGMFGKSWGGFNGLQVAARRPPALKAIITIYSTDDRYADDVHYMGGAVVAFEMLSWASVMLAYNATPPDPRTVGRRWREMWLERIEHTPAYVEKWLAHQRRDAYWQQGSVCENYADIDIPVMAVGGWADGYTNAVLRLLAGLPGPKLGLIGPWAHVYPEEGLPGPAIGFLQESLRWWDTWLKGGETGIMDEPQLRAYLQESILPQTTYDYRPGRWVGLGSWPADQTQTVSWQLGDYGRLLADGLLSRPQVIEGHLPAGFDTQAWCPYGAPGDFAPDQQAIDGQSLTFTSDPQPADMDVLGFPQVSLTLAADRLVAQVIARLCDVAPDGRSTLVSYGVLNLTHRHSHEHPQPVVPGQEMAVNVSLNAIGHTLKAGHRWRLAIAPHYWPMIWPAPETAALTVLGGALTLPRLDLDGTERPVAPFLPAEVSPPLALEILRSKEIKKEIHQDLIGGDIALLITSDGGRVKFPGHHLILDDRSCKRYAIKGRDPLSAEVVCEHALTFERDDWQVRVETYSRMTATSEEFVVENTTKGYEADRLVVEKQFSKRIPRDFQ